MPENSTNGDGEKPDEVSVERLASGDLTAEIVKHDNAPDKCTLYPVNVSGEDIKTKWITAEEGSFVSIAAME